MTADIRDTITKIAEAFEGLDTTPTAAFLTGFWYGLLLVDYRDPEEVAEVRHALEVALAEDAGKTPEQMEVAIRASLGDLSRR